MSAVSRGSPSDVPSLRSRDHAFQAPEIAGFWRAVVIINHHDNTYIIISPNDSDNLTMIKTCSNNNNGPNTTRRHLGPRACQSGENVLHPARQSSTTVDGFV